MRSTHTYAVLEISPEAHAEIKAKLLKAGYQHAISGETIDMHGIALESEAQPAGVHHCHCSAVHKCDINVHPDPVVHAALSDLVEAMSRYDVQTGSSSRVTMHTDCYSGGQFHSHTFNDGADVYPPSLNLSVDKFGAVHGTSEAIAKFREFAAARAKLDKHGDKLCVGMQPVKIPLHTVALDVDAKGVATRIEDQFVNVQAEGDAITGEIVIEWPVSGAALAKLVHPVDEEAFKRP